MLSPVEDLLRPAIASRALLWANHVLASHPLACDRLRPHAGKRVTLTFAHWPLPFGAPRPLHLAITPAGLLEGDEHAVDDGADLRLAVDLAQPWKVIERLSASELPEVDIQGDAALAAEVSWVLVHVRWDMAADVERVFGPVVADGAQRAGGAASAAAKAVVQGARTLGDRLRPR